MPQPYNSTYNPKRGPDWNYGGKNWKLSRSKIDLFLECPRCFYIDNKLGTKRVPGPPFLINSAVDHQLKQEFDTYRKRGISHPLQTEFKVDAVPAQHEKIDEWRDTFKGVQYLDEDTGLIVSGAIDDLWIDKKGNYIVVDYKATAKDKPITELDETSKFHDGYKRQMEVYQWLLRKNELPVSSTAYFVYCTAKRNQDSFNKIIEFDIYLIAYEGDDSWVEGVIQKVHSCLEDERVPKAGKDCEFCPYREAAGRALQEKMKQPAPSLKKQNDSEETGTLF